MYSRQECQLYLLIFFKERFIQLSQLKFRGCNKTSFTKNIWFFLLINYINKIDKSFYYTPLISKFIGNMVLRAGFGYFVNFYGLITYICIATSITIHYGCNNKIIISIRYPVIYPIQYLLISIWVISNTR